LSRRYFPPVAFSPLRFGAGRGWRVSFIQQADAFPEQSPSEFVILLHLAGNFCLRFLSGNREHFRCGILGGIILGGIEEDKHHSIFFCMECSFNTTGCRR